MSVSSLSGFGSGPAPPKEPTINEDLDVIHESLNGLRHSIAALSEKLSLGEGGDQPKELILPPLPQGTISKVRELRSYIDHMHHKLAALVARI